MVLHGRPANEPTAKDIYNKLLPTSSEKEITEEEEITLIGAKNPTQSDSNPQLDNCCDGLNCEQVQVMKLCQDYFKSKKESLRGNAASPKPFNLLIHGGPGTGKSFLANRVVKAAESLNLRVISMAFTGIAAGLIPGGDTCHHTLSINCGLSTSNYPPPLRPEKVAELRRLLNPDTLAMVIIDEISFIGPEMMAIVSRRLNEIVSPHEPNKKFGSVAVVAMGDFYQLPPVGQESLFTSVVNVMGKGEKSYATENSCNLSETREDGARLFAGFRKIDLVQVKLSLELRFQQKIMI